MNYNHNWITITITIPINYNFFFFIKKNYNFFIFIYLFGITYFSENLCSMSKNWWFQDLFRAEVLSRIVSGTFYRYKMVKTMYLSVKRHVTKATFSLLQ